MNQILARMSYQQGGLPSTTDNVSLLGSRAIDPPTIRSEAQPNRWFGNTTLNPNRGLTNSYDTTCIAFHEWIQQIRAAICGVGAFTLLLVFVTSPFRLFDIGQLLLCLFVGALAAVMTVAEASVLFALDNSPLPQLLRKRFGIIFTPVGKVCLLGLLSTLCFALKGFFETVLGLAYFALAAGVLVLNQHEEFRSLYYPEAEVSEQPTDQPHADFRSWSSVLVESYEDARRAYGSYSSGQSSYAEIST